MDVASVAATATVTAICGGIVGAIVSALVAGIKSAGRGAAKRDKAMVGGIAALLWRELKNIHEAAVHHGGMTLEERKQLEYVYAAYSGLGYNDTGRRLYEDSMEMPIL